MSRSDRIDSLADRLSLTRSGALAILKWATQPEPTYSVGREHFEAVEIAGSLRQPKICVGPGPLPLVSLGGWRVPAALREPGREEERPRYPRTKWDRYADAMMADSSIDPTTRRHREPGE